MENAQQEAVVMDAKVHFNYNKLQATICIVSSSVVSIGLLAWAFSYFA